MDIRFLKRNDRDAVSPSGCPQEPFPRAQPRGATPLPSSRAREGQADGQCRARSGWAQHHQSNVPHADPWGHSTPHRPQGWLGEEQGLDEGFLAGHSPGPWADPSTSPGVRLGDFPRFSDSEFINRSSVYLQWTVI